MRKDDGVDYLFNFAGRTDARFLSLVPAYLNVQVRFVEGATWASDLCTYQRTLASFGDTLTQKYRCAMLLLTSFPAARTGCM